MAAMIYLLAQTGIREVPAMLTAVAVTDRPQARWLAALARHLLAEYPVASSEAPRVVVRGDNFVPKRSTAGEDLFERQRAPWLTRSREATAA